MWVSTTKNYVYFYTSDGSGMETVYGWDWEHTCLGWVEWKYIMRREFLCNILWVSLYQLWLHEYMTFRVMNVLVIVCTCMWSCVYDWDIGQVKLTVCVYGYIKYKFMYVCYCDHKWQYTFFFSSNVFLRVFLLFFYLFFSSFFQFLLLRSVIVLV